jgi:hypothetical protein
MFTTLPAFIFDYLCIDITVMHNVICILMLKQFSNVNLAQTLLPRVPIKEYILQLGYRNSRSQCHDGTGTAFQFFLHCPQTPK